VFGVRARYALDREPPSRDARGGGVRAPHRRAHGRRLALARAEFGQLPRAVNFVSGPSRTADIDQTIVLGAHGPYRVHIIVVRD